MYPCAAIDIQSCALICEKLNQRWPCSAWNSIKTSIGNSIETVYGRDENRTVPVCWLPFSTIHVPLPTMFNHQNNETSQNTTQLVRENQKFRSDSVHPSRFKWVTAILRIFTFKWISRALSSVNEHIEQQILHFSTTHCHLRYDAIFIFETTQRRNAHKIPIFQFNLLSFFFCCAEQFHRAHEWWWFIVFVLQAENLVYEIRWMCWHIPAFMLQQITATREKKKFVRSGVVGSTIVTLKIYWVAINN